MQQGLAEHLHIVWTGGKRLQGSEDLHFLSREVSSFMDKERNVSLSSHPFLPLAILSLSFPSWELLLHYSLCAEWKKVIRSPLGHIHSWKEEEWLHRLLPQLYGAPDLSSTLSDGEEWQGRRQQGHQQCCSTGQRAEGKGEEILEGRHEARKKGSGLIPAFPFTLPLLCHLLGQKEDRLGCSLLLPFSQTGWSHWAQGKGFKPTLSWAICDKLIRRAGKNSVWSVPPWGELWCWAMNETPHYNNRKLGNSVC